MLYRISKKVVYIIFCGLIIYLWLLAGFSTSIIGMDDREHTYMIGDSFAVNLYTVVVVAGGLFIVYLVSGKVRKFIDRINTDDALYRKSKLILLTLITFVSVIFVVVLRKIPRSDQMDIIQTAMEFVNKDYSSFSAGNYMDQNPHQIGIVLFLYGMMRLIGTNVILIFQFLNVCALVFIYRTLADFSELCGNSRFISLLIIASSILFIPGILYTTFVYGTLIGLCFSLLAMKYVNKLYSSGRLLYIILVTGLFYCAVSFKSNYVIFIMAELIYIGILVLRDGFKNKAFLAVVPILVIVLFFSNHLNGAICTLITKHDIPSGESKYSWIAMGMQQNDSLYDGWWNDYNGQTYEQAEYDTVRQNEIVFPYIRQRLSEFAKDPAMTIDFFSGKNASQWNNPDFQGGWVNYMMSSDIDSSNYVQAFFSAQRYNYILAILNRFQFLILSGVIIYLLYEKDETSALFPLTLVVVGGFIFHTLWEAKAQYILPYFILLIPFSANGYGFMLKKGFGIAKNKESFSIRGIAKLLALAMIIGIIDTAKVSVLNDVFLRNADTDAYYEMVIGLNK